MDGEALLAQALRRTDRGIGWAGLGTLLLGGFMIALDALGLDPEAGQMGLVGKIALYGFGGLFALTGLLLLYVALVKGPARAGRLLQVVREEPSRILRAYGKQIKTRGAEQLPGGQRYVCVQLEDGAFFQIMVRERELEPLLAFLWERAPRAARDAS